MTPRALAASIVSAGPLLLASVAASAQAVDAPFTSETLPAIDDRIHVDLTPDLWGLSMTAKGRIGGQPAAARVPLGTIIKHLDNLFLGQAEIRKGHFAVLVDATHAAITLPGSAPLPAGYRLPISATFVTLAAGWRSGPVSVGMLGDKPVFAQVQPFVGATYDYLDAKIDGPQGTVAKLNPTWWSPVVGSRVDLARGRSSLRLEGYFSGFTDRRSGQQALASYAYRLHWRALGDPVVGGGWRYSRQFRAVGGDNLALKLHGPVAYMTFTL